MSNTPTTPEAALTAVERAWRDLPAQLQAHPGIKALHRAALAAPARVPAGLRAAAEFTREDLGPTGSNYPHIRTLLAFAEDALGIVPA